MESVEESETRNLEFAKDAARKFYSAAQELLKALQASGEAGSKAAEALGLARALKDNNQESIEGVLLQTSPENLGLQMIFAGKMEYFAKFYSISKKVFAQDRRFQRFIEALENLFDALNTHSKNYKFILPSALFSNFDKATMRKSDYGCKDNSFMKVRSVMEAFHRFRVEKEGNVSNYVAEVQNVSYIKDGPGGYLAQVATINPSEWAFAQFSKEKIIDF